MRQCGDCQLCCELVPVSDINKIANERCQHQRRGRKRCSIYAARPISCQLWSCRWLADPEETAELSRPDRSHCVIDVMPDFIGCRSGDDGEISNMPVVQVWVDPKFPTAHRDPALRRYLAKIGHVTVIRYGARKCILLVPPSLMSNGEWLEREEQPQDSWVEHSAADVMAALAEAHQ
jgi:hypothetical protein